MKNAIRFKVKAKDNARNEMHFEVQRKTRANVFKPKKGKGSFKRVKRVDFES